MCLVVVFVVFIHAYQLKPQWKGYDDVFRGRTNAAGWEGPIFCILEMGTYFSRGLNAMENFCVGGFCCFVLFCF
jgi:hypothetical protein